MKNETNFKTTVTKEEIALLPRTKFCGEIRNIDTLDAFYEFFPLLNNELLLGFDTETKPAFKKGVINEVSLLQLSTSDQAFLFRLNYIGLPKPLLQLLSDPEIIKAGVAVRDDLSVLNRLSKFNPAGFIDLQKMVKDYGIEDNGLKKLAANILGFNISKRQQTSNWEQEQLSIGQIEYAATDAWICYEIYKILKNSPINNAGEN
jgi:ribonuclease D